MISPFDNLSKTQIKKLLNLIEAHTYSYHKNEEILPTIKYENIIGIIMSGEARIIDIEYNGTEDIQETLPKDSIFGTSISIINNKNYQVIAKTDCEVTVIDYDKLMNMENLNHPYFNIFLKNLFEIINLKIKKNNERIRVLKKKQIREKLLEYFEIEYKKRRLRTIHLPFTFKDLASYLAIDRSAMFRELKSLKEEKILKINGRSITLLYKENFIEQKEIYL